MVTFEHHRRLPMCHLGSSRDGRLTLAAKMEFGWFRLTHQYWKYWLFVVLAITGGIGVWIGIWIFLTPEGTQKLVPVRFSHFLPEPTKGLARLNWRPACVMQSDGYD